MDVSATDGSPPVVPVQDGLFTLGDDPALLGSSCASCGALHFPRTDSCPYCGAGGATPCLLPTDGSLWAWTTVTAAPPGYDGPVPFGFGIVELAGQVRVVTRLTEPDAGSLRAGQAVHLVLTPVGERDGVPVVSWAFAPGTGGAG